MRKSLALAAILLLAFTPFLSAQGAGIQSTPATVGLTYTTAESITVSAAPTTATFTGAPPTTGNIVVTTTWNLVGTRTIEDTYFYFTTTTAALSDGSGDNIPASDVFLNVGGGSYLHCSGSANAGDPAMAGVPTAGGTCSNGQENNLATTHAYNSSASTTITLQLQGLPSLPAGTYTGTLDIVAQAL